MADLVYSLDNKAKRIGLGLVKLVIGTPVPQDYGPGESGVLRQKYYSNRYNRRAANLMMIASPLVFCCVAWGALASLGVPPMPAISLPMVGQIAGPRPLSAWQETTLAAITAPESAAAAARQMMGQCRQTHGFDVDGCRAKSIEAVSHNEQWQEPRLAKARGLMLEALTGYQPPAQPALPPITSMPPAPKPKILDKAKTLNSVF